MDFNDKFGLRYHCGEFTFDSSNRSHFNHMYVSCKIILAILARIKGPTPLRIGHGVAFLAFEKYLPVPVEFFREPITSIYNCLKEMQARGIPIEVNLRSNAVLLPLMDNAQSVNVFLNTLHLPVVICTDDDGIWSVSTEYCGETFFSVAAEFATAFKEGAIPDISRAQRIVKSASDSKFDRETGKRECLTRAPGLETVGASSFSDSPNASVLIFFTL